MDGYTTDPTVGDEGDQGQPGRPADGQPEPAPSEPIPPAGPSQPVASRPAEPPVGSQEVAPPGASQPAEPPVLSPEAEAPVPTQPIALAGAEPVGPAGEPPSATPPAPVMPAGFPVVPPAPVPFTSPPAPGAPQGQPGGTQPGTQFPAGAASAPASHSASPSFPGQWRPPAPQPFAPQPPPQPPGPQPFTTQFQPQPAPAPRPIWTPAGWTSQPAPASPSTPGSAGPFVPGSQSAQSMPPSAWPVENRNGWPSAWPGVPTGALPPAAGSAATKPRAPWPQLLAAIVVTALIAAMLAAGGTYLALSPNLAYATKSVAPTATPEPTPTPTPVPTLSPTVAPLIDSTGAARLAAAVEPAVVTIVVHNSNVAGSGSGFVVSEKGLIVTNNHVIDGMTSVKVTFRDGHTLAATVVAADPIRDLAVISVDDTALTALPIGSSAGVQIGDTVVAFGNPLGEYPGSATIGVVSGLDRDVTVQDPITKTTEHLMGLLQTDATATHGNSGGPLVNSDGEVVGVVVAGDDAAPGINFAVPIDEAQPLIAQAGGL